MLFRSRMTAQSPVHGESRKGAGSLILLFLLPSSHVAQRGEVHIDDPAGLFVNGLPTGFGKLASGASAWVKRRASTRSSL